MSNPGSILAIDDQAVLLMNMAVTLEAEGYAVDTAIDESSALATAASTHPDVFLVDLRLGKSDGVKTRSMWSCRPTQTPTAQFGPCRTGRMTT